MKRFFILICCSLLLTACETLDDLEQGVSTISTTVAKGSATAGEASQGGAIDFRKDEVLCSVSGDRPQTEARYKPAKIMTPSSTATKNQAEVLYPDGTKEWTYIVLPSHKASENELTVGGEVLYMRYASDDEDMNQDKYRSNEWQYGTITSTDELFKGVVEIGGRPMFVRWVRIPE